MRCIVVALHVIAVLNLASCESSACHIEGISSTDWFLGYTTLSEKVQDVWIGDVITYNVTNITDLQIIQTDYMDAVLKDNKLTLSTTTNFQKFEEESKNVYIEIELKFTCANDTTDRLKFIVYVEDTNNHRPELNQEAYEYNFLMEIPKKFDVTEFLPINATDADFTNTYLTFSMDDDKDFEIGNKNSGTADVVFAKLEARRAIPSPYNRRFNITVTDSGTPQSSTTVPVTITISSAAPHSLLFTQNVYYGTYVANKAVAMEEPVQLQKGDNDTTIVPLNYPDYFTVSYDKIKNEVVVNNVKELPQDIGAVLELGIKAETPGSIGVATVIIRTDTNFTCTTTNLTSLNFTKAMYYGNYVPYDLLQMDEPVQIEEGWDNTTTTRLLDHNEYFEVSHNITNDKILVKNIKELPRSLIEQNLLLLGLESETPGKTFPSKTVVVVRTNGHMLCYIQIFGHSYDSTNLIIGVSVTAVILLVTLNVGFFGCWYKHKMKKLGLA